MGYFFVWEHSRFLSIKSTMNWNDDDPFIKWGTRIYVAVVLVMLPLGFYFIVGL